MLRRISVEDVKKRKRFEDDSIDKIDPCSEEDEPSPKKARIGEKTESLDLLAQLSAQQLDEKRPMPHMNLYMAMPAHPMPMAMSYPLHPPANMKMGREGVPLQIPITVEKGNNVPPPLSFLINHLPPSSMPVSGYSYHPQMYTYPMYYMRGSAAQFMQHFPNGPVTRSYI